MSEGISESEFDALDDATWGPVFGDRTVSEAQVDSRAAARGLPTSADFRAVGLSESDAAYAAKGVQEGLYFSFEDACWSAVTFDRNSGSRVDPIALAETAKRFAQGAEVES